MDLVGEGDLFEAPREGRGRLAVRVMVPLAFAVLIAAIVGGLARMGVLPVSASTHRLVIAHGPLLVSGFFGTVIAVERVAERSGIAWAAPPLLLASALLQVTGTPGAAGVALAGSVIVHASDVSAAARRPTAATAVAALASLAWCGGNLLWLRDQPLSDASPWWIVFLVLVIASERVEEALPAGPFVLEAAAVAVVVLAASRAVGNEPTLRVLGIAFASIGTSLIVADREVRKAQRAGVEGRLGRAIACALGWLIVAGGLLAVRGWVGGGLDYDAVLHAVFVGFVLSMLFGHGPAVLPRLLGRTLVLDRASELPLVLLQIGLAVRVAGDLGADLAMRRLGGGLNALAVLLFFLWMARAIRAGGRKTCASGAAPAG